MSAGTQVGRGLDTFRLVALWICHRWDDPRRGLKYILSSVLRLGEVVSVQTRPIIGVYALPATDRFLVGG